MGGMNGVLFPLVQVNIGGEEWMMYCTDTFVPVVCLKVAFKHVS